MYFSFQDGDYIVVKTQGGVVDVKGQLKDPEFY